MTQYLIKLLISSSIIVIVSEIAKKNTFLGGLITSIPLVSVLAILWLYIDTKDVEKVSDLSISIFWLVIPSLALFISLPILLKQNFNFYTSIILSILITIFFYWITISLLKIFGIRLS